MEKISVFERVLIERVEQMIKHGKFTEYDAKKNTDGQLINAAVKLIAGGDQIAPSNWDTFSWAHTINKPLKDRLIIAAALIIAEIDRLEYPNCDCPSYNEKNRT